MHVNWPQHNNGVQGRGGGGQVTQLTKVLSSRLSLHVIHVHVMSL